MGEFTAITTQEEFDRAIGSRLKRERETISKEYEARLQEQEGKIKDYEKQIGDFSGQIEAVTKRNNELDVQVQELTGKVKGHERASLKVSIAHEAGLPYEMASRLSGEDEDAIRKDADSLKKIIGNNKPPAQRKSNEPPEVEESRAAVTEVLRKLKGE